MLAARRITAAPSTSRVYCAAQQQRHLRLSSVNLWQNFENERHYEPGEEPLKRTWHGLTYEFKRWKRRYYEARMDAWQRRHPIAHMKHHVMDHELLPHRTEVLILGGGLTGSSVAYWIKQRFRDEDYKVTVVENTDNFAQSRSVLGAGVITQQFSTPEMVEMAQWSAEFLRHAGEHLKILDNDPPDINLLPVGFLNLAATDEQAEHMREAWKMQIQKGVHVAYLGRTELRERFPDMNFDGIVAGTYGLENEGIIDAWQLLGALREKNITLGVHYIKGEVEDFSFELHPFVHEHVGHTDEIEELSEFRNKNSRIYAVNVRPQMTGASARRVRMHKIVNCAGPWAGRIARSAGIGDGTGMLAVPMSIEPRKRMNFLVNVPDAPPDGLPALMDPSGVHCRPDAVGHNYICGKIPSKEEDKLLDHSNLDVDYDYFYEQVWPVLAKRFPSFQSAKMVNGWATYADVNTFDDAPILGEHLLFKKFYQMSGFANFGDAQMSIAAGRLYMERELDEAYTSINVRKFDMRRIMMRKPFREIYRCPA